MSAFKQNTVSEFCGSCPSFSGRTRPGALAGETLCLKPCYIYAGTLILKLVILIIDKINDIFESCINSPQIFTFPDNFGLKSISIIFLPISSVYKSCKQIPQFISTAQELCFSTYIDPAESASSILFEGRAPFKPGI